VLLFIVCVFRRVTRIFSFSYMFTIAGDDNKNSPNNKKENEIGDL